MSRDSWSGVKSGLPGLVFACRASIKLSDEAMKHWLSV